ncbi:MAG: type II toxin-antitoxin system RelE/ParE family toxin [Saccharofermentans sp.]|nr:type II toxin-antitoxin system RelE/ParE family toxin [Saccharofermentans sp.]
MKISYANNKVEKIFTDYRKMQRTLPADWVKAIKKHIDRLSAAECFGDFLTLGLGKPEKLTDHERIRYSLHIAPNIRLILEPKAVQDSILLSTEIEVEGVCDYHGSNENWYIP